MTPRKRVDDRTAERTETSPGSAKTTAAQGNQPASNGTDSAPNPAKLVRKGRALSAGARLRRDLLWPNADPAAVLLVTQAARLRDRLEVIDRLLSGDAGAWLAVRVAGQVAEVRVTDLVREERQQSEVLRKIIMDIQRMRPAAGGKGDGGSQQVDPVARIVAEIYGRKRA